MKNRDFGVLGKSADTTQTNKHTYATKMVSITLLSNKEEQKTSFHAITLISVN